MLFPDRLRSQYFFCAMSLMALGAHRGRPVAAAPCTPGLRPATRCEPVRGPGRPGKTPAATRRNIGATGNVPARAALSRATASMLLPGRLRSRLIVCVMAVMALGAHRGRPVAAAPCTPGLPPPGINAAPCLMPSPGGAVACRANRQSEPDK